MFSYFFSYFWCLTKLLTVLFFRNLPGGLGCLVRSLVRDMFNGLISGIYNCLKNIFFYRFCCLDWLVRILFTYLVKFLDSEPIKILYLSFNCSKYSFNGNHYSPLNAFRPLVKGFIQNNQSIETLSLT